MTDDELDAVDLQLGPAEPVSAHEIHIKVDGLPPERIESLRSRVADVLDRERESHALASGSWTPPPARERRSAGDTLEVRVLGQSIGTATQQALEDAIGQAIDDELGDDALDESGLGGVGPSGSHCVCVHTGLGGDRIPLTAPPPWFTASGAWIPPPSGLDFWKVGIMFDAPTFNQGFIFVRPGSAADPPFGSGQTLIGLTNATAWPKQIWATNLCEGRVKSVFQRGTNNLAHQMQLVQLSCRAGTDTIEFSKPGWLGHWHDVGHIGPGVFWPFSGGTWAIFEWVID